MRKIFLFFLYFVSREIVFGAVADTTSGAGEFKVFDTEALMSTMPFVTPSRDLGVKFTRVSTGVLPKGFDANKAYDLMRAYARHPEHKEFLAVGMIYVKGGGAVTNVGTGVLVAPNILLTNAHVVSNEAAALTEENFSFVPIEGKGEVLFLDGEEITQRAELLPFAWVSSRLPADDPEGVPSHQGTDWALLILDPGKKHGDFAEIEACIPPPILDNSGIPYLVYKNSWSFFPLNFLNMVYRFFGMEAAGEYYILNVLMGRITCVGFGSSPVCEHTKGKKAVCYDRKIADFKTAFCLRELFESRESKLAAHSLGNCIGEPFKVGEHSPLEGFPSHGASGAPVFVHLSRTSGLYGIVYAVSDTHMMPDGCQVPVGGSLTNILPLWMIADELGPALEDAKHVSEMLAADPSKVEAFVAEKLASIGSEVVTPHEAGAASASSAGTSSSSSSSSA